MIRAIAFILIGYFLGASTFILMTAYTQGKRKR